MLSLRSLFVSRMTRAALALTALCAGALALAQSPGKTEVLWLGQSTTRTTTPGGKVIVIDPWLTSNPAMAVREMIRPKFALPIHYGSNPMLRGTPAEFKAALGNTPAQMLAVEPGQKVDF
jgi:L-ascorbate metabolism protein UlaG (beta-lactamase superfamily)